MPKKTFAQVVSAFGAAAKAKLTNAAITGAPEDQLRNPLEVLIREIAEIEKAAPQGIELVGETTLAHLQTVRISL